MSRTDVIGITVERPDPTNGWRNFATWISADLNDDAVFD
jgi:hypothetical protein